MSKRKRLRYLSMSAYILLMAGIFWQCMGIIRYLHPVSEFPKIHQVKVNITGNVRMPGLYAAPEGTSQFEILKVAGIRSTSDISAFNLTSQIDSNTQMQVGTLDKPAKVDDAALMRLEFYYGQINAIAGDGSSISGHEGLVFNQGDRIQTEASSQAEISIGSYSRVDLDNFSELVFDKIGTDENGKTVNELFQKNGACWYKIAYNKNTESFRVVTPTVVLTIGGKGADFLVDIQPDQININLMDGLILVERTGGSDALNMITGQSVTIYSDGRPFQVSKLTPEISATERFSQLSREKINYSARLLPFNFVFCSSPFVFYVISVQFDKNEVHMVRIPPELTIKQFAQNISTIDQAYLFGGPVFVSTFIERILSTHVPKYCVFNKDDIIRIAGAIGGISTNVDQKAASYLNTTSGKHKLTDKLLVKYLSPGVSGVEDSKRRQGEIIKSMFEQIKNKNIVITALLADQIISNTETNFNSSEIMENYTKFMQKQNWTFTNHELPVKENRNEDRVCYDPDLEKCKTLINSNQ